MGIDAVIFGGNWDNGANCGSRSSNWNNSPTNSNNNIGCRGVCDDNSMDLVGVRPVRHVAYGRVGRPSNLWSAVLSCFGKYLWGSGRASSSLWKHMVNDAASFCHA